MESTSTSNLFELHIDHDGSAHLKEAARWAKFLAIVGMVLCSLFVLMAIFAGSLIGAMMSRTAYGYGAGGPAAGVGYGAGVTILYILFALLYFFPCLYLYRFGVRMQAALRSNELEKLNGSFRNLKAYFRFIGILTIIALGFVALGMVIALIGLASVPR